MQWVFIISTNVRVILRSFDTRRAKPFDTLLQSSKSRFIKQLYISELEDRRLKGLSFNCDEPFTKGHRYKKLFWLELIDEDDELDPEPVVT